MNSRKARVTAAKAYAATNADIDLLANCKAIVGATATATNVVAEWG